MISATDRALVLKTTRYEDRHLVVTALTETHGKVTAIARSAIQSRRFGAALELFALSTWEWTTKDGADLLNLKTATLRHDFAALPRQMTSYSVASLLVEIVLRGTPHDDHSPDLFKLLVNALVALEKSADGEASVFLAARFLLKYLHWAGHFPKVSTCVNCGEAPWRSHVDEDAGVGLSVDPAGILCSQCVTPGSLVSAPLLTRLLEAHSHSIGQIGAAGETTGTRSESALPLLRRLIEILQFHIPGFDRSPLRSLRSLEAFREVSA